MLFRVIAKSEIPHLVNGFLQSYEVVGPVAQDSSHAFAQISDPAELVLEYGKTILPPKKYILPSRETLLEFSSKSDEYVFPVYDHTPRVLFGLHSCDICALNRLDTIYKQGDYLDPYYRARRDATLVVGISCVPQSSCFCALWGTGEVYSGYDLFLHDLDDSYLVSISSVEGADMLEKTCLSHEATEKEKLRFQAKARAFSQQFAAMPDISELSMVMDALHQDDLWSELGTRCLSCTACSAVCPTCSCFTLCDVMDADGSSGQRMRTWDSCCSPEYALVANGFNFRPTARERVRHRFYHKLLGFKARNDHNLCVGCGRCIDACKADINPLAVIEGLYRDREQGTVLDSFRDSEKGNERG